MQKFLSFIFVENIISGLSADRHLYAIWHDFLALKIEDIAQQSMRFRSTFRAEAMGHSIKKRNVRVFEQGS